MVGFEFWTPCANRSVARADLPGRKGLVLAPSVLFCCILVLADHPAGTARGDETEALALAREAATAAKQGLKAGSAEGTYRVYNANKELLQDADFRAVFDGPKYYFRLTYRPVRQGERPEHDRRIVVCDGSELFVSRFSERIHPTGAHGDFYRNRPGARSSVTRGFGSDMYVVSVAGVINVEHLDEYEVRMEKLPDGCYRGSYEILPEYNYTATFEISPKCGYNAVLSESMANSEGKRGGPRFIATWDKDGDLWYINGLIREMVEEGKVRKRQELRIKRFEANIPISPELFTLKALELPAGTRMLDRRGGGQNVKAYRFADTEGEPGQKQADRLIEQVEAMPEMYQRE